MYNINQYMNHNKPTFVIGTSSKIRLDILNKALSFKYKLYPLSSNIDEKQIRDKDPEKLVIKISKAKLDTIYQKIQELNLNCEYIYCSDQVVVFEGQVREKPNSIEQSKEFLKSYENKYVETIAGTHVMHVPTQKISSCIDKTKIHFNDISGEIIDNIISRNISKYCCGGLVIEDEDLVKCINHMDSALESVQGVNVNSLFGMIN